MEQEKQKRGRPKGSSRLNQADDQILIKVAVIVEAEAIPASTAMHRLGFRLESSGLRRLQRKWKVKRDWYMLEARSQAAKIAAARSQAQSWPSISDIQRVAAQVAAVMNTISPAVLRAAESVASISDRISKAMGPSLTAQLAIDSQALKALQSPHHTKLLQSYGADQFTSSVQAVHEWQKRYDSIATRYAGPTALFNRKG